MTCSASPPTTAASRPRVTQGRLALSFDPWSPRFLPDQRHYLFYATRNSAGHLHRCSLEHLRRGGSSTRKRRRCASTGHLLFVRQGTLFAQAFDPVRLELVGSPVAVSEQIVANAAEQSVALSAAAAGPIVYRTGPSGGQSASRLVRPVGQGTLKRSGRSDIAGILSPALSLDGASVGILAENGWNKRRLVAGLEPRRAKPIYVRSGATTHSRCGRQTAAVSRGLSTRNRQGRHLREARRRRWNRPAPPRDTPRRKVSSTGRPMGDSFSIAPTARPGTTRTSGRVPLGGDRKPFPVVETRHV